MPNPISRLEAIEHARPDNLTQVRETISKLRFGSVLLTIHDGELVQMDVTEKRRFPHLNSRYGAEA